MLRINQIKIPVQKDELVQLKKKINRILRTKKPYSFKIVKQSLDARDKHNLMHIYCVDILFDNASYIPHNIIDNKNIMLTKEEKYIFPHHAKKDLKERPVIIGAGPAGYFAALMLARAGYRPIVFERGKCVEERTKDVETFWNGGAVCSNSNVSFGEGGAGTFSDGKLNTGIKDRYFRIKEVVRDFIRYGAPEDISYINKPHIGTDELKQVLAGMRTDIISLGGEICFEHQLTDLSKSSSDALRLTIMDLQSEKQIFVETKACILAIGHSARDTFSMLNSRNIDMEAKAFAMGLRIEHKQSLIDEAQYGTSEAAKLLPAADYKMTFRSSEGRSVYSFCMCPGGFVVNASSDKEQCVVNGMSNHARNEENANSAIVVNVTQEDFAREGFSEYGVLAGVEYQKKYEKRAYELGKGRIPVQTFGDFCKGEVTKQLGAVTPSVKGGYTFANLKNCLPAYINNAIIEGINDYNRKMNGFSSEDAVLSGIESRTSSPVRIVRDENFMSSYIGLFPCGEGAGYAGGITSAAVDGIKVAEAVAAYLNTF